MGTSETDKRIDQVFRAKDRGDLLKYYDDWAATYDADLQQVGYLHTPVIIGLVARFVPRRDATILDAGVGTGAIGGVLSILGYNNLSGIDMSESMLAVAKARGCYADLRQAVLGEELPFTDGAFDAIISTGTFTQGHAPAAGFDELARILEPGGHIMFTVGTMVWEEQGFAAKLAELVARKILVAVDVTPLYRPMPHSQLEGSLTTRAHVYRKA